MAVLGRDDPSLVRSTIYPNRQVWDANFYFRKDEEAHARELVTAMALTFPCPFPHGRRPVVYLGLPKGLRGTDLGFAFRRRFPNETEAMEFMHAVDVYIDLHFPPRIEQYTYAKRKHGYGPYGTMRKKGKQWVTRYAFRGPDMPMVRELSIAMEVHFPPLRKMSGKIGVGIAKNRGYPGVGYLRDWSKRSDAKIFMRRVDAWLLSRRVPSRP